MTTAEADRPVDEIEPLGVAIEGEGPPLVAVHGGLAGGRLTFGGMAPVWARHHRVIVADRPGFERTGGDGEVDIATQADRLIATVRAHTDQPCHALGFSFGGLVVLRAIQQAPQLFASLTLVETPAVDLCPSDMVEPTRFMQLVRRTHEAVPTDPAAMAAFFTEIDPRLWAALSTMLGRDDPGITPLRADLAIWTAKLDRQRLADAVSADPPIPVLAVSGSTSAASLQAFGACTAAALWGRHEVIDGAGHAAHLHPDFTALLLGHTDGAGPGPEVG